MIAVVVSLIVLLPSFAGSIAPSQASANSISQDVAGEYTITIRSWLCDSGVTIDPYDPKDLAANCDTPMDGMWFWLYSVPTGTVNGVTQGGTVRFAPPEDRPWYVRQRPLNGYTPPSAHCVLLDGEGETVTDLDTLQVADSVYFEFDHLEDGNRIECDWYSIPDGDQESGNGSLTIFKWTCPDGYDHESLKADPFNDCREGPDGVAFTLTQPTGEINEIAHETGDAGQFAVAFTGLDAGPYLVGETMSEDTASVFVWQGCANPPDPSLPAFEAVKPVVDMAVIQHNADGGDRLCHWFNVEA